MADEVGFISGGAALWSSVLTAGLAYMGYFAKKRDDKIDANQEAIVALELKVAENYATKPTMLALFDSATTQTKEAVARVEKSIDSTNASVGKLDLKIDKVSDSINVMQQTVMNAIAKK